MSAEKLKKFEASEKKYYEKERGLDDRGRGDTRELAAVFAVFGDTTLFSFSTTSGKEKTENKNKTRQRATHSCDGSIYAFFTEIARVCFSAAYLRISSAGGGGSGEEERFSPLIETFCGQ